MNDAAFDDLVATADPAMIIVTTAVAGERAGCLVGFHTQCSIGPRRYAVWLSKANHTYRVALQAEHLAVHFLSEVDTDLAVLFGTESGDDTDKFSECSWHDHETAVPVLDGCRNHVVGRRIALHDEGGDHVCIVIEVVDATFDGSFTPLRLSGVDGLDPGHGSEERPHPPTERGR